MLGFWQWFMGLLFVCFFPFTLLHHFLFSTSLPLCQNLLTIAGTLVWLAVLSCAAVFVLVELFWKTQVFADIASLAGFKVNIVAKAWLAISLMSDCYFVLGCGLSLKDPKCQGSQEVKQKSATKQSIST